MQLPPPTRRIAPRSVGRAGIGSPGATLAVAGQFLSGADLDSIRAYRRSVKEVKPKRFDVGWNSDVVPFRREAAMNSLRAISEDGSRYARASSDPAAAGLKPGKTLWLDDIAIRWVKSTEIIGDSTVVDTEAKPLAAASIETCINT